MFIDPMTTCDFYKVSHKDMYPEGTEMVYSNFTPRSSRLCPTVKSVEDNRIVFFGLQGFIQWFLQDVFGNNFFGQPKEKVLKRYKRRMDNALGPDSVDTSHIEALHDLGYLPLEIMALPEGSKVDPKVPVFTVHNTKPEFFWLVNYLETVFSNSVWKPMVTSTIAYRYRQVLEKYAKMTGVPVELVDIQGHDFSCRGMSGPYDAAMSGAGHLVFFGGTDTISAIDYVEEYYGANSDKELVGCSVPATEHSVVCMGGKEGEIETFRRLLEMYPEGILSLVSDTWDFWKVITEYTIELKEEILNRQPNGLGLAKTVFRPDCYDESTQVLTNSGWKYFKNLTEDDLVAQVENGEYSFVKPEKIVAQEYEGPMQHFKDHHGKVDLLVTPNHRMVLEQNGKERIVFAEKLGKKGHNNQKMSRSAKAKSYTKGINPLERLKIAFQADGAFSTGVASSIRFSFSKKRKIERMKWLLSECNLFYNIYDLSDGRKEFDIKVGSSLFSKNFDWVDTSNLCGLWCEGFIDELKHWDSSIRSEGRFKFDTTNKSVVDVVEYIALSAGYGIYISKSEDSRSEVFSDVYTAHIITNNKIGGQSWTNTVIDNYTGRVYCVKVPSGKLIVKRNQCTMVCGNSGDPVDILCGTYQAEYYADEDALIEAIDDECSDQCGQGETGPWELERVVNLAGKVVKVNVSITYEGAKQDFGDRLYFVEDVHIVSIEEHELTPEEKGAVQCLYDVFGGIVTETGYKQLHERVGLIYGDSITLERCEQICQRLADKGFSSGNVVFGIGSFTYQYNTRDTIGGAMKATYGVVNGGGREIFKDPATDSGTKKSAKGLLHVEEQLQAGGGTRMVLKDQSNWDAIRSGANQMKTVFMDGVLTEFDTFATIRERVRS